MKSVKADIFNIMKENNGVLKTSQLDLYAISKKRIQRLALSGDIERIAKGLYLHPDFLEDEYYVVSYRVPRGIFSYESSLYLHKLSDESPVNFTLTIPSGWNSKLLKDKDKYRFHYLREELWGLGKEKIKTPYGNEVPVYSKERTLAEMVSKMNKVDRNLVLNALKVGIKNNVLNNAKLLSYADIFKSKELMRAYLEGVI